MNVDECITARPIYNGGDRNCHATAAGCQTGFTAEVSTMNVCTLASNTCTDGRGYNSTTKLCIAAGMVTDETQCVDTTKRFFNPTAEDTPTAGNCVASANDCDADEMVGTMDGSTMTCQNNRTAECAMNKQVYRFSDDMCIAPADATACAGGTSGIGSAARIYLPAAVTGNTDDECVVDASDCPSDYVALAGAGGTMTCTRATAVCHVRGAAIDGVCLEAQWHCPEGMGFDPSRRRCESPLGSAEARRTSCQNANRHLAASGTACIARSEFCGAGNVLSTADGVACHAKSTCRSVGGERGAVQGDYCVAASRNTCLADGGLAYNGTNCVAATAPSCMAIGATFMTDKCVETDRATRLNALRGTTTADEVNAEKQGTGKQLTALATLRTMVQTTAASGNNLGGLDVMTGTTKNDNRLRIIYANQPSLDAVGAAFAYHANNDVVNFGKGSTVSYITDRNFFTDSSGDIVDRTPAEVAKFYGFDSTTSEDITRTWVHSILDVYEFPYTVNERTEALITRAISENNQLRRFFSEAVRKPRSTDTAAASRETDEAGYVIGAKSVIGALRTRLTTSGYDTAADNGQAQAVGNTWAAIVRAAATHYGLSVDTGAFSRWLVFGAQQRVHAFEGTAADDVDRGLLNLIAGLIDISDATISSPAVLRHMTHGIAPSANLNVLTTYGMRPESSTSVTNKWIGSPTQGFVATDDSGKNLPRLAAGINLFDAIQQAGAPQNQKRGNAILFDNRLAAQGMNTVLRIRNPLRRADADCNDRGTAACVGSDGNMWRFVRANEEAFDSNLVGYFALSGGAITLRKTLDADNDVKIYEEKDTVRGDELGAETVVRDIGMARVIIEGLYGSSTTLWARSYHSTDMDYVRNDRGGDVITAVRRLMANRHSGVREGVENHHHDALIFAAQKKATGNTDIGLFAGLPLYIHNLVNEDRARIFGTGTALGGGLVYNAITQGTKNSLRGTSGYRWDEDAQAVVFEYNNEFAVFYGPSSDPFAGSDNIELLPFFSAIDPATNSFEIATFGTGLTLYLGNRLRSPLPYYLAVVAAEADETPCGIIAQNYCITAPGTYAYRAGTDATLTTTTTPDPNAAAALVAGGVALLQDVFKDQLSTEQIIARLKATASQDFDLDNDGKNDYVQNKASPTTEDELEGQVRYGHGMLDLACASRPSASGNRCKDHDSVTPSFSDRACEIQGRLVKSDDTACVTACAAGEYIGRGVMGKNNTCLANAAACVMGGQGTGTDGSVLVCVPPSVSTCQAAGGIFNTVFSATTPTNTCIARSACDTSNPDIEILNGECRTEAPDPAQCLALGMGYFGPPTFATTPRCFTATGPTCVAAGGVLDQTGSDRACITRMTCTDRTAGNRYIDSDGDTCVEACVLDEGLDTTTSTCLETPMTGAHCNANDMRVYNAGTMACETEATCTARTTVSDRQYVDATFECVVECPDGEGAGSDKRCTSTVTVQECNNVGRAIRLGACVGDCEASDGIDVASAGDTCITTAPTPAQCFANINKLERNGMCVDMCMAADGIRQVGGSNDNMCVTSTATTPVTGDECDANGNARKRGNVCVATCMAADGFDSATHTCITGTPTGPQCAANGSAIKRGSTCVAMCRDTDGLDTGTNTCIQSGATEAQCMANRSGLLIDTGGCVRRCDVSDGRMGDTCITTGQTAALCQANNSGLLGTDGMCVAMCPGTQFTNVDEDACTASCGMMGANASRVCQSGTPTAMTCSNAGTLFDDDTDNCVEMCSGTNNFTNIAMDECVAGCGMDFGNSADTMCVASCGDNEGWTAAAGTNDRECVVATSATAPQCAHAGLVLLTNTGCVAPRDCADGQGVENDTCTDYASLTNVVTGCNAADRDDDGSSMCLARGIAGDDFIEAFRGAGNTAEDSALIDSSGFTDSSTTAEKRQREYANQPSLDMVGAAFAYGAIGDGVVDEDTALLELGKGSHISVMTRRRFDPTHPEFSSSDGNAEFKTLTRFYFSGKANTFTDIASVVPTLFADDSGKIVQVYTSLQDDDEVWFSVPVGQIDGMNYEDISRSASANNANRRDQIAEFLATLVGGSGVTSGFISDPRKMIPKAAGSDWAYEVGDDSNYLIPINTGSDKGIHHAGRTYDTGNIRSYQVVIRSTDWVRGGGQSGECNADNDCYDGNTSGPADGAEMGIFALINGMMNPDATGVGYNTHGIAPGARLDVVTSNPLDDGRSNGRDMALRARSIDIGRDSGADDERNIVIIQDSIRSVDLRQDLTRKRVNDAVGDGKDYKGIYEALQIGLADTNEQDAYVFAARGGNKGDVGILAGLPISTKGDSIKEYSIIVVAAEASQTQCGSNTVVQEICIAAPGKYQYRNRSGGTYAESLSEATSADAAASLVAGGLALLESIFSSETTSALIDRLLKTASQNYDFGEDGTNDYTDASKHGQGLMDLACAIKPIADMTKTNAEIRTAAGCVDRVNPVSGMSAPPQQQQPDETPTGFAQGDPLPEEDFNDNTVDYCNIKGLRIILSGDLCSSDYILLADEEGNLLPETVGNLRFGMGFGDSLLKGLGITFFDAFDTAWTVSNKYNPYAHILSLSNIVIAPVESRFDVEDRFYAMRYGTRPGQRKTWRSDTAAIVMDFATQGMATKPYGVTRGQIRNTLTHDNMGADPYADVRFMLSAEDNLGIGRLKVMTYSGMAMGYALGLHAQGDAMMPSYLLTNRDSFHAPYLSLASSGLGGGMTYRFRDGGHIGFVMGEGTSLNADGTLPYQQQTSRPRAFAGMMEYAPHKNLMFQMGALQEESTLLASQGSGLFDIEGGATAFVGVQAKQPISDNWQALFSGYGGRTQLAGSQGIVSGLDVVTTSFDVGLLGSHVLEQGDHLLFRAGQPMRVESGSLDLSYVSYRDGNRGVVSGTQSFDVAPSMRSVEFGVGYGVPVGERQGHIRFAIDYVMNPGHRRVQNEVFGIMSFRRNF